MKTTQLGNLVARTNYSVETAVRLKEYLTSISELDIYSLLYQISKTPDIIPVSFKGRRSKEPVREKLNNKGVFVVDIGNTEATAATLMEWIEERTEYQIENIFHVYAAGTRRTAYDASLMVKFFKQMCEILNVYSYTQDLEILSARLYYGVKDDLIPLVVGIKRLGRKRARALVKAFGTDLSQVSKDDLLKVEGIGPKIAENIKKNYPDRR
jgi:helicase